MKTHKKPLKPQNPKTPKPREYLKQSDFKQKLFVVELIELSAPSIHVASRLRASIREFTDFADSLRTHILRQISTDNHSWL